jgi:Flp pilus assembly protein TadD
VSLRARVRRFLAVAALALASGAAGAQAPRVNVAATVAQADSAWSRGDRERARALYADVLASDSTHSRAVFRLAQLAETEDRALVLYRWYIALERADPWGHMAEGDVLARLGRWEEALLAYGDAAAIAPGERDVALGRARILDGAGRPNEAAAELAAWLRDHPDDGEAWDLLGRARMRAGRPQAASVAFENAARRNVAGAAGRLATAESRTAPTITPDVASAGDSDGNRTSRIGGEIDFAVADGVRLGAGARYQVIANDIDEVHGNTLQARLTARPMPGLTLAMEGGATRFGALTPGARPWTPLHATARLRARAAGQGPSLDLRGEHTPLAFSPQLVANQVSRSEARVTAEVPLAALRLRGTGRVALFQAPSEPANRRIGAEGALVIPLGGGRVQPSAQYRVTGFQRASTAGYFAPRRVETADAGVWLENGDEGRLSLSADLGAGAQRVEEHAAITFPPAPPGRARTAASWTRAWRAWGQAALAIGPSRSWYIEVEAYDAPFSPDGVSASGSWRYLSVISGLRWSLR